MAKKGSTGTGRTRNFATVVYPESAPENWMDILTECFVPCYVSPLHDKDVNPTGEEKKAHYHVLIAFDSVKTLEQAKEIVGKIGGVGCEKVNSLRGYARYLCHLDNPEKHQYSPSDVKTFCGADYHNACGMVYDKYTCIKEMVMFCKEQGIISYCDLLEYCMLEREDWYHALCDSATYVIKEYLKSKTWSARMENYYE